MAILFVSESTAPSTWTRVPVMVTLLLVGTLSAILVLYYRSWKRLAHVPGPTAAHVSILWLLQRAWNKGLSPCLIEAGNNYGSFNLPLPPPPNPPPEGPVTRIGPNLVLVSDPDELRRISGIRSEYTKGPAYDAGRVTEDSEPHVASQRDPAKHKALKAKMGPAYSLSVEPAVDRQIAHFVSLIENKYAADPESGRPARSFDFAEKTQFWALDSVGDFAFGSPFGFLTKDDDVHRFVEMTDVSFKMVTLAGLVPWLNRLRTVWPLNLLVPREGDRVGFGILFGFAKDLIDRRTAQGAEPCADMMQAFIRSGMTKDELMQQVYIHIVAGAHAPSNLARMAMLSLLTCPPAYLALQREIDAAIETGQISSPATGAEVSRLPYVQAAVREALRLYPPSVSPSKLSPPDGDTISGIFIPGGTQVGANVPGMLRSEAIFGADAQCFRPERWLEAQKDEAKLRRMRSALDLVFGTGKFQCPGRAIVYMEVGKLFVELMRRFDFALMNNVKPVSVESWAVLVVYGMNVRVTLRRGTCLGEKG
ncbi:Pisatin demethylase [Chaetomidium leptoderma]|uniref:Pisatin demethylase n=1 Tax=Chaetomidium leptoderma TaxID=669021 RepID=A0AAN6VBX5_9PEZI|nr:Pisatin demethylase [Chaetomidium leptoderma]